jgi:hypothetical protein
MIVIIQPDHGPHGLYSGRRPYRQGYEGIFEQEFIPLVTVNVGTQRRKGWVQLPYAGGIPMTVPSLAPGFLNGGAGIIGGRFAG